MTRFFFTFCILFTTSFLFATTPQEQFDKLARMHSFGEAELAELRAIMAEEKESGEKVDCTFCPDAFTWYLASRDLLEEATWLFERNADYGIKDNDGMTMLHLVCRNGNQDFAKLLLDRGAEINLPDDEGRTAIHYAVMSGNAKLVESLLLLGSDPNKLTKKKDTPLHFAAMHPAGLEEIQALIEHGASIKAINWTLLENLKEQRRRQDNIYNNSSEAQIIALKTALGLKTPESLQEDEEDEESEDDDGGERYANAFEAFGAPQKNKEPMITDLDHIPFDLLPRDTGDAANLDGMTALHFAAQNGNTEIVKYLVENGADIKAQDSRLSRSPIHFAAENGNLDCVKYLAEKDADLQDQDSHGATALHYAAKSNNLEVVKFLVSRKMDYTARDVRGWTAMHYAANGGSIDVVKYLLAKGLNINERNKSGRTPLFFAKEHHDLRVFMISQGAQ